MSRIGRMPITVPAGVTVNVAEGNVVTVKGPKGELTQSLRPEMIIKQEGTTITVERPSDDKLHRSVHGLTRTLLHNMVIGVTEGFKKELDVNGVGYRVAKEGNKLVMNLGFSHQVIVEEVEGIKIEAPTPNKIIISGTKSTAPRKPIDIKLKSKMMSPKDPVVSKAAEKSTAIMVILTSCRFFFSSKLFFRVPLTTSRLMIVLMPNASPAPVPTTAISKVAMTMPPSHEGIYSMTNCGKAIFAETRSGQFSFMYIPMRMPPTPIGGIMNALISAPFLASLSLLPDKHACA